MTTNRERLLKIIALDDELESARELLRVAEERYQWGVKTGRWSETAEQIYDMDLRSAVKAAGRKVPEFYSDYSYERDLRALLTAVAEALND